MAVAGGRTIVAGDATATVNQAADSVGVPVATAGAVVGGKACRP